MKKAIAIFGMVALFATAGSLSFAGQPPGLEKKGKVPPGFSQGKKTGWENDYPPGWDQKSEQEKKQWKDNQMKGKNKQMKEKGKGSSKGKKK